MKTITVQGNIRVKDSGDGLVEGFMQPLGLTLRGRNLDDVLELADDALKFFLQSHRGLPDGVDRIQAYLDRHSIGCTIVDIQAQPDGYSVAHVRELILAGVG